MYSIKLHVEKDVKMKQFLLVICVSGIPFAILLYTPRFFIASFILTDIIVFCEFVWVFVDATTTNGFYGNCNRCVCLIPSRRSSINGAFLEVMPISILLIFTTQSRMLNGKHWSKLFDFYLTEM